VLVYDTAALDSDLELTGPITVRLAASSSAPDTDFTATLVDLHPDGYAHLVQEGIVRASYRESDSSPTPIEPGRIYEYEIDLWATSYVVRRGHRIRVEISSSNFDRFDRNLNTGEPFGTGTRGVPAAQQVFHTNAHASRITLPIAPR
jgi:putative CocE/NonD family hydrolase